MKYVIETNYAWYNKESTLILVYFINGVPFTFDELPEIAKQHPEVIEIANSEKRWEPEDIGISSAYLILEDCHPMLFEIELENPELLPSD